MSASNAARAILLILVLLGAGAGATAQVTGAAPAGLEAALVLRDQGDMRQAIARLRSLLRADPDSQRLREELGYALILDRQFAAAQYHFQILLARSRDPERRALYQAVLRRIVRERPAGLGLIFALVPSSNLNGGSSAESLSTSLGVLPISVDSQAVSGWRQTLGLSGYARAFVGQAGQVRFDAAVLRNRYSADLDHLDEARGTVTYRQATRHGNVALGITRKNQRQGDERWRRDALSVGGTRWMGQDRRVSWTLEHARNDYRVDAGRSGPETNATLRYGLALRRAQEVWVGLRLERSAADAAHLAYRGRVVQAGGTHVLRAGPAISGVLSLGWRDFDGVFPLQSVARVDRFTEVSISLRDDRIDWGGFSPRATCRARFNHSNIALYDQVEQECGLVLTRAF